MWREQNIFNTNFVFSMEIIIFIYTVWYRFLTAVISNRKYISATKQNCIRLYVPAPAAATA